jgi:indoleacetamide hydrolase
VAQNALIRLQAAGVKLVEVDARGYFSLASQTVFSPAQIEEARGQGRHRAVEAYTAMFAEHRLAAIVFPTHPIPVSKFRNTHVTSVLGAPGLSIPAGLTAQGLPVGLEFDALAGYDTELLALGIAVEQAWPKIPPPQPIP